MTLPYRDPDTGFLSLKQLFGKTRFHVASGLLEPGEEIPSTRALSARLGVNPMTISKAFGLLEEDGVLERRPGRPHVVRERGSGPVHATKLEQLEQALRPGPGNSRSDARSKTGPSERAGARAMHALIGHYRTADL